MRIAPYVLPGRICFLAPPALAMEGAGIGENVKHGRLQRFSLGAGIPEADITMPVDDAEVPLDNLSVFAHSIYLLKPRQAREKVRPCQEAYTDPSQAYSPEM